LGGGAGRDREGREGCLLSFGGRWRGEGYNMNGGLEKEKRRGGGGRKLLGREKRRRREDEGRYRLKPRGESKMGGRNGGWDWLRGRRGGRVGGDSMSGGGGRGKMGEGRIKGKWGDEGRCMSGRSKESDGERLSGRDREEEEGGNG